MSKERAAALVDAGVFLQLAGDVKGARELFERALSLDPENVKAQRLLGQARSPGSSPPPASSQPPPVASQPPTQGRPVASSSRRGVQPALAPPAVAPAKPTYVTLPPPVPAPAYAASIAGPIDDKPTPVGQRALPMGTSALPPPLPPSPDLYTTLPGAPALVDPSTSETIVPGSLRTADLAPPDPTRTLVEVDAFIRYGMYDRALDFVMRLVRVEPENISAHERAYTILLASGHRQAAIEQLINVLRLCAKQGDSKRARPWLETLRHERPEHPELPRFYEVLGGETTDKLAVAVKDRVGDATVVDVPVVDPSGKPRRR